MSRTRFFVEDGSQDFALGSTVTLTTEDSHHAANVLRLHIGSITTIVFIDTKRQFHGRIVAITPLVEVSLENELVRLESESSGVSTLLLPLLKGSRNEDVADWATELGVGRIIFWHAERSISRIRPVDREAKLLRWNKIVEHAAKQSSGSHLPALSIVGDLNEALSHLTPKECLVCLSLSEKAMPLTSMEQDARGVALLLGPEGDLTSQEEHVALDHGASFLTLGERILRSEIAALSGIVLINAWNTWRK